MTMRYDVVHAYDQSTRDMAFAQYVLNDRKAAKAHRALVSMWDTEWGPCPDLKTVERWARNDNWSYRADLVMSETFPQLYQRDIARLVALRGKAIATYDDLMDGTWDGKHPMSAAQAARHVLDLTAGGFSVAPPKGAEGEDSQDWTPEERAARQKQRLEAARGKKVDKKRGG